MPRKFKAISVSDYPKNFSSNCLAFALGLVEEKSHRSDFYDLNINELPNLTVADAFLQTWSRFEFEGSPRQIANESEAQPGEYVFKVMGFNKINFFGMKTFYDFHITRRELDGTWVHKPDWDEAPRIVTSADLDEQAQAYGSKYVMFAFNPDVS